jgi:hypothetical protein
VETARATAAEALKAPLASPTFTGSVTIPGGSVNSTTIGGTTPAAGAFTTLGATGAATFSGGITGTLTGGASLDLPLAGGTMTGTITNGALSGTVAGAATVTATGSTTARTLAARAADVVNVMDFGAKGDGITDDTAAINSALSAVRALGVSALFGQGAEIDFPDEKVFRITGPLNFTLLTNLIVDGHMSTIYAATSGQAALDMMGASSITVRDLNIQGDQTHPPRTGIQFGITSLTPGAPGAASSFMRFERLNLYGYYTLTAIYNFAGELFRIDTVGISNSAAGSITTGGFGLIMDGINHWGVTSSFVTQVAPANAAVTFNEALITHLAIDQGGAGSPGIWMSGTRRNTYITCYVATLGAPGVVLFNEAGLGGPVNEHMKFDLHQENVNFAYFLAGDAYQGLGSWEIYDHDISSATTAILGVDTNITDVVIQNAHWNVGGASGPSDGWFGNASLWHVIGDVVSSDATGWTQPASFTGWLRKGGGSQFFGVTTGDSVTVGGTLSATGSITTTGQLNAANGNNGAISIGSDAANGNIELGVVSTPATPYIDFSGNNTYGYNVRLINNSAGSLSLSGPAGASLTVGGPITATGPLTAPSIALTPYTSSSIGGSALLAGACSSTTVSITGLTTAMVVDATPATYPGDSAYWKAYASAAGTATVKVCEAIAGTPTASIYNIRVIQ